MGQNKSQNSGTSLIELMVALAVFAVMVLGLFSVLLQNHRLNRISKEQTAAINVLRNISSFFEANVQSRANLLSVYDTYYNQNKGFEGLPSKVTSYSVAELERKGLNNATTYSNNNPILVECFPVDAPQADTIYANPPLDNADLDFDGKSNFVDTTEAGAAAKYRNALATGSNYMVLPMRLTLTWKDYNRKKCHLFY